MKNLTSVNYLAPDFFPHWLAFSNQRGHARADHEEQVEEKPDQAQRRAGHQCHRDRLGDLGEPLRDPSGFVLLLWNIKSFYGRISRGSFVRGQILALFGPSPLPYLPAICSVSWKRRNSPHKDRPNVVVKIVPEKCTPTHHKTPPAPPETASAM